MTNSAFPDDPEAMLALGREVLGAQPFSVLMEARLEVFAPGRARLSLPLGPRLLQQFGHAHGGVVSYLADNALTFAGGSVLGPAVTTAEYKINYIRPARGEQLVAEAWVVNAGRRLAVVGCSLHVVDGSGIPTECALAQGTIATLNDDDRSASTQD
ncbi:PaaI family thioesterase [Actinopolymorpha sp. B9G3]|uniref:PaaI family thioesterase n=1 Tax=Actinopolymorpha sp. B9G3 TaxID=3158970 RepID=UPI0032D8C424